MFKGTYLLHGDIAASNVQGEFCVYVDARYFKDAAEVLPDIIRNGWHPNEKEVSLKGMLTQNGQPVPVFPSSWWQLRTIENMYEPHPDTPVS